MNRSTVAVLNRIALIVFVLFQVYSAGAVTSRNTPRGGGSGEKACDQVVEDKHGTPFSIVCQCQAATIVLAVNPFPFIDPNNPHNPPVTLGSRGQCQEVKSGPKQLARHQVPVPSIVTVVRTFRTTLLGIRKSGYPIG